ncbi:hypothetical protein A2803_03020 [Candidatus Woesebacteria bacterium RIFCSPHIGHO2_01_FULL_44_21]|uniref:Prepilin leader peptidase/N-methyltransferase n=1 Tax=Candidatus Woesebacteria bacterium RIFCSPHIGHO2_01_FULL_44_21 TaxID=1802503 RepID=A0A1F7Z0T7_9BACT|nr:MAG: hypothetical protein A2803_03020 [Candidatus Woesebacteria bacterium RIFCSPHIGHO2_01_FULL_44_21]OGM69213.1 MAG: hypothetical protein A2897_04360 [Candidatus Woesebacteria bacterium RIFCSPLOWO2_01_FULL_44_24b]
MALAFLFLLGAVVGSFVGALTWRWPRKISIRDGRSRCPHCKHVIGWYDNIPILSYLLLRGRCRACGKKIPKRDFFIEVGMALLFPIANSLLPKVGTNIAWSVGLPGWIILLFVFVMTTVLVAIFIIDLEHQYIPDSLVFGLLLLVIGLLAGTSNPMLFSYLAVGLGVSVFLLLLHLLTLGRGMGLGDVKLALALGTILGFPLAVVWMFSSFILGAILGLMLIAVGKAKFKQKIAFGPFMVAGFFMTLVFGFQILDKLFSVQ